MLCLSLLRREVRRSFGDSNGVRAACIRDKGYPTDGLQLPKEYRVRIPVHLWVVVAVVLDGERVE